MPRTVWSGAISFGLISIPVKLFSAVSHQTVRFNQIDSKTGSRVKMVRTSAKTGEEVAYADIVKGYDLGDDNYVILTDEEMESIAPKASRSIDLVDFVEEADIDPIFYESGYFLAPDEMGASPTHCWSRHRGFRPSRDRHVRDALEAASRRHPAGRRSPHAVDDALRRRAGRSGRDPRAR
ncbi:MAG: Ku protein [Acidimicrobiales bacterium]